MSKSQEHLKDEVGIFLPWHSNRLTRSPTQLAFLQGSKTQTMIAGATAGVVSRLVPFFPPLRLYQCCTFRVRTSTDYRRFCVAPLDVIKIRLQLQARSHASSDPPLYRSTLSTFRTILKHEGITVGTFRLSALCLLFSPFYH